MKYVEWAFRFYIDRGWFTFPIGYFVGSVIADLWLKTSLVQTFLNKWWEIPVFILGQIIVLIVIGIASLKKKPINHNHISHH
jgi:hypothetical protein